MNINPINYARGLMLDIEASTLHGLKERRAHALAELTATVEHLRTFDVSHFGPDVEAMRAAALADAESFLAATPKTLRKPAAA